MTPEAFVARWKESTTLERAAAQEHFIDLCRLLGEKTPHEADAWKRGCFGWEYKGKGKDLGAALKQLQLYALALESPPLLIVLTSIPSRFTQRSRVPYKRFTG